MSQVFKSDIGSISCRINFNEEKKRAEVIKHGGVYLLFAAVVNETDGWCLITGVFSRFVKLDGYSTRQYQYVYCCMLNGGYILTGAHGVQGFPSADASGWG